MNALEKQTRLQQKQTHFILTLAVTGAVNCLLFADVSIKHYSISTFLMHALDMCTVMDDVYC